MSKEAMKLALEALKKAQRQCHYYNIAPHLAYEDAIKAIEIALSEREALANHIPDATKMVSGVKDSLTTQQEQGEHVAIYQFQNCDGSWIDQEKHSYDYNVKHGHATVRVVYTTPQQRKPLTDEQIRKASLEAGMQEHYMDFHSGFIRFAKAIEAAHGIHPSDFKEKNT